MEGANGVELNCAKNTLDNSAIGACIVKKLAFSAICAAIVLGALGCNPISPLSPPSWINGTWADQTGAMSWQFTADNVIQTSGGSVSIDYRKMYTSGLTDSSTTTSYTFSISASGVTISYRFDKVNATTINYVLSTVVTLPLTKQ
jgi:hypothetical protein